MALTVPSVRDADAADVSEFDRLPDERLGFSFDLYNRNKLLAASGAPAPPLLKTGTTICGTVFKDGVVLAADTRATMGTVVAEKLCQKVHKLAPNIYCCGAGGAADLMKVSEMIASSLSLQRFIQGRASRVSMARQLMASHLFNYGGYVAAHMIVGGVDIEGTHLMSISADGCVHRGAFVAMGSGGFHALSALEAGFKKDMTEAEGVALVTRAITAGIMNDMGSGSQVDVAVVTRDTSRFERGVAVPGPRDVPGQPPFRAPFDFPKGSTKVLQEQRRAVKYEVLSELVARRTAEVRNGDTSTGGTAAAAGSSSSGMAVDRA